METSLSLFLLSAAGISLTGVMLPGPMTAATIARGRDDKHAGALIAIGHAAIEIPLIAAIYFGLAHFLNSPQVVRVIYVAGGLTLLYLGFRMFRNIGKSPDEISGLPMTSFVTGIVVTGTNPAFYIWWATIGMALVAGASKFGLIGIISFTLVHWPCDLVWYEFLSAGTFKSRKWWTKRIERIVFTVCASILAAFGLWFFLSAIR
jgi:threonine/homoserine/homoserine lactone efflux protein